MVLRQEEDQNQAALRKQLSFHGDYQQEGRGRFQVQYFVSVWSYQASYDVPIFYEHLQWGSNETLFVQERLLSLRFYHHQSPWSLLYPVLLLLFSHQFFSFCKEPFSCT